MEDDQWAYSYTDKNIADIQAWDIFDPSNFSLSTEYDPREFGSISLRTGMRFSQIMKASEMCDLMWPEIDKLNTATRVLNRTRALVQDRLIHRGYRIQSHSFNDLLIHEEGPSETVYRSTVERRTHDISSATKESIHRIVHAVKKSWKPFPATLPEPVLSGYKEIARSIFILRTLIMREDSFPEYLQLITQDNDPFAQP